MAFIPDEALDRYDELQPASQIGYSFICRHRNHHTGTSPKTLDDCAAKYGWSRATKYNVQKELTAKGWIEKTERGIRPVVGDFSPVDKSKKLDSDQSKNLDFAENQSKNLDSESKNLDKKSKNLDSHIRNNQPLPERIPAKEYISPRESPKTAIGHQNGILASDVCESDEKVVHLRRIVDGMKERLGTPGGLPKEFEWISAINFAWMNEFSAERFFETFDLLERIRKKKSAQWRVTAGMVENNIADTERLQIELRNLENGTNTGKNGKGTNNGGGYNSQDSGDLVNDLRRRGNTTRI